MAENQRIKIDVGNGHNLSATWSRMSALEIYNRLLAGGYQSREWSTTERRLWALDIFKKRFTLRLPDLVCELRHLWPHWECNKPGVLDVDKCCRQIEKVFEHIEKAGRPFNLDEWRPTTTRSRSAVADADRIVRRFLDNGFCKPKTGTQKAGRLRTKTPGNCRVHVNRKAMYSGDKCPTCYVRYNKLRAAGILPPNAAAVLINAVLKIPAVRGRASTLIEDARRVVKDYLEENND